MRYGLNIKTEIKNKRMELYYDVNQEKACLALLYSEKETSERRK